MNKILVTIIVLIATALSACTVEPEVVEITRIVEVPRALTQFTEIEVTRLVELPTEIEVTVEVEVPVEVEVTRLVAELEVTRLVEVPVEIEVTRIVTEAVVVEIPSDGQTAADSGISGFSLANPLNLERHNHTATLLRNGQVLIAGGSIGGWQGPSLTSTEIYRPDSNTWRAGPSLNSPRQDHTATALPNGRVFLTGGTQPGPTWQSSTEMLDARGARWETMAPLAFPRSMHTATLLDDGRILVLGGWTGSLTLDHAEIYDPVTNTWSESGSLLEARQDHSATLLPDGRILIVGGYREQGGDRWLNTAEIYDPDSGNSTQTSPLFCHGTSHQAVTLADGRVLIAGGACGNGRPGIVARAEIFDPETDTWQATAPMNQARFGMTATRLADGTVLAVGGGDGIEPLASVEQFDPATESWARFSPLNLARAAHTATLLPDGRLLIVGGWAGDEVTLRSAELLDTND